MMVMSSLLAYSQNESIYIKKYDKLAVLYISAPPLTKGELTDNPYLKVPLLSRLSYFQCSWEAGQWKKKRRIGRSKWGQLHLCRFTHMWNCRDQSDSFLRMSSFSTVISLECGVCKCATLSSHVTCAKWSLREGRRCFLNALSLWHASSAGFLTLFGRSYDGP